MTVWTIVFLRSTWAAAFLILFLLWRDGRKTVLLFKTMGYPGIAVAVCFATASATFIVALQHTTVANILLIQASTPLVAALIGRLVFRERVAPATWVAIAAVILGATVMVSGSLSGKVSPVGDMLAVLIALMFATATVVTRRYAGVRMTPACCLGRISDRPRSRDARCLRKQMQRLQDIAATLAILAGLALMVLAVSPAHAGMLDHQSRPACVGGFGDQRSP